MNKTIIIAFVILFYSCNENRKVETENTQKNQKKEKKLISNVRGTWICHNNKGFKILEIESNSNVSYSEFVDRKALIDSIKKERYWLYNSKAKLDFVDSTRISILTDKYRFDYKINKDTLIEYDKMGNQDKLIKVK
ncbi:hypothetical protein [Flavobacterium sp.]|jgi:hypothetical protein|uniref:hypothetical protein n=1 Tax=Flavobacterium sp. TaxID=239 RepID=UPI0037C0E802